MVDTFVCYMANDRAYVEWLERGQPDGQPDDLPFWFPDAVGEGSRYVVYVGSKDQVFVGYGSVLTNWKVGRTGAWKGVEYVEDDFHRLRTPLSGAAIQKRVGYKPPSRTGVIDVAFAAAVWRAIRSRVDNSIERAPEGLVAEARSKQRSDSLRQAARTRANGNCEVCRSDFNHLAGGLGLRCLVVHHTKQMRDRDQPEETQLTDLAVVCANCHMMIHTNPEQALSVKELRRRLAAGVRKGRVAAD